MATTQPQQNFVASNFDSGEVKSQATSSNVVSTPQDFTQQVASATAAAISHGIVVTSQNVVPAPTLPANTVTLTVQPTQIQTPQTTLITANVISGDEFQAKEGILQNEYSVANFGPNMRLSARSIPHLIVVFLTLKIFCCIEKIYH